MPKGYLLLVLHAHLPYVRHPEYDRFLEERWFFEAVTETYIPLIKFFDRLQAERIPFQMTLSISPTLANMMEDPLLRQRCLRHLDLSLSLAEKECEHTKDWPDVHPLAWMYRRLFEEARTTFVERCGTRPGYGLPAVCRVRQPGADHLRRHARLPAAVEFRAVAPCSARSSPPWTSTPRIFGSKPKGLWVPECAFYPGLDEVLAQAGIRYFLVDGHGIEHAEPAPMFGVHAPVFCPSGVAAFGRHPMTSKLVWSTSVGYPADFNYREYYRDIGFERDEDYLEPFQYAKGIRQNTGIKYHRITGKTENKCLYNPDWGAEAAVRHAHDFANRCRDQARRAGSGMPFAVRHRLALRRRVVRPLVVRGSTVDLPRPARAVARRRSRAVHAGRLPGWASDSAGQHAGVQQLGRATASANTG